MQSPQKHIVDPLKYSGYGISGKGNNFCRNTDTSQDIGLKGDGYTIWCYTTDLRQRWEYCDPIKDPVETPKCTGPKCPITPVIEKPIVIDKSVEVCSGTRCDLYRGKQNVTITGKTCQAWAVQSPQKHVVDPSKYSGLGIDGEGNNFCRNTDTSTYPELSGNTQTIWCYTTDPSMRWDKCEPLKAKVVINFPQA